MDWRNQLSAVPHSFPNLNAVKYYGNGMDEKSDYCIDYKYFTGGNSPLGRGKAMYHIVKETDRI